MRGGAGYGYRRGDGHSDTAPKPNICADPHSHTSAYAYLCAHADGYAYAYADSYSHAYTNANTNAFANPYRFTYTYGNADCCYLPRCKPGGGHKACPGPATGRGDNGDGAGLAHRV